MRVLCSVLCLLPLVGTLCMSTPAQPDTSALVKAATKADAIVLAQVVRMVDTKPGAVARKAHETHWVRVTKTLKDYDIAGQVVKVRPNGMRWNDGQQVLLFLSYRGAGFYEAARLQVAASDLPRALETIRAIAGAPKPKLALRMRFVSCGCGPTACACPGGIRNEFALQADGKFDWLSHHAANPDQGLSARTDRRIGAMVEASKNALVQRIARTKSMELADCGGVVEFAIAGNNGQVTYFTHSLIEPTNGLALVALIEETVATLGTTTASKR